MPAGNRFSNCKNLAVLARILANLTNLANLAVLENLAYAGLKRRKPY